MSINIADIESNEDAYSIYTVISQMQHDKKSYGLEGMLRRYEDNIEKYRSVYPLWDFCAMLAYLEYHDKSFSYDSSVVTEHVIADFDLWCERFRFKELSDGEQQKILDRDIEKSIPEFLKRGIILDVIDEVM